MTRRFKKNIFGSPSPPHAMQTAIHLPNFKHKVVFVKFAAVTPVSVEL